MRSQFQVHMLNEAGKEKAQAIAGNFDALTSKLEALCGVGGREMAIVLTKLEEACFFAKKSMASRPENQAEPVPGPVSPIPEEAIKPPTAEAPAK